MYELLQAKRENKLVGDRPLEKCVCVGGGGGGGEGGSVRDGRKGIFSLHDFFCTLRLLCRKLFFGITWNFLFVIYPA